MAPKLQVLSTPEELRAVTALQLRTFIEDGTNLARLLSPSSDPPTDADIDRATADLIKSQEKERAEGAESVYWAAVDDADGSLMAAARWVFYHAGSTKTYETPVVTEPGEAFADPDEARAHVRYRQWAMTQFTALRASKCKGPHALLELCFTAKAHRRRGAAFLLVDAGVRRCDELGIRAYVEGTGHGPSVYEKCGFRVVKEVEENPEGGLFEGRAGWVGFDLRWMERPVGGFGA